MIGRGMNLEIVAAIAAGVGAALIVVWELGRKFVSKEGDGVAVAISKLSEEIRQIREHRKLDLVAAEHPHRCRHNDDALREATAAIRELTRAIYEWRGDVGRDTVS